jgi:hypothetical protein
VSEAEPREARRQRSEVRDQGRNDEAPAVTTQRRGPANDELTFVLVLVLIIVIEAQEKGQKFATMKCQSEDRELGKSSARTQSLAVVGYLLIVNCRVSR